MKAREKEKTPDTWEDRAATARTHRRCCCWSCHRQDLLNLKAAQSGSREKKRKNRGQMRRRGRSGTAMPSGGDEVPPRSIWQTRYLLASAGTHRFHLAQRWCYFVVYSPSTLNSISPRASQQVRRRSCLVSLPATRSNFPGESRPACLKRK